ncbi:hypothetical protein [Leptospira alstonii]|uniref:Uncharacterized protein n=2 Tax=Leptospira alstonii TaxID=28452 RepID=M6CVE5_9LEPT|nr:hypothetical protein [Leptospira alstonii]EMJ94446.1 hypothetical protein LEP1GSC194_2831 [Leptospira alstonii serovar Sichuan str. 79601]EQA82508.1 hypothetical protein LEP1GSC193_1139 [Leptospira alstonii serovar Pingchang str. 80-412]
MKKTVPSKNQTYFSANINEMASAKLSPLRFFSGKSEEAIDKLMDEIRIYLRKKILIYRLKKIKTYEKPPNVSRRKIR